MKTGDRVRIVADPDINYSGQVGTIKSTGESGPGAPWYYVVPDGMPLGYVIPGYQRHELELIDTSTDPQPMFQAQVAGKTWEMGKVEHDSTLSLGEAVRLDDLGPALDLMFQVGVDRDDFLRIPADIALTLLELTRQLCEIKKAAEDANIPIGFTIGPIRW